MRKTTKKIKHHSRRESYNKRTKVISDIPSSTIRGIKNKLEKYFQMKRGKQQQRWKRLRTDDMEI